MLPRQRRPGVRLALVVALTLLTAAHAATPLGQAETTVLVAYYSCSGNTRTMAEAVVEGVRGVDSVQVILKSIDEVTAEGLAAPVDEDLGDRGVTSDGQPGAQRPRGLLPEWKSPLLAPLAPRPSWHDET